ncbi:unnamed protein product [Plutella xylostella]|uniref:(diamondback moth) hypothetical protein n=1 Tax=Plutella xylostella TaxID=51655 RepID=A0A8S4G1M3_PLUXY|nr:unnamed protein product [Plutella xylostella]
MSLCAEASITAEQLGDEALALGLALVEADTWAAAAPSGLTRTNGTVVTWHTCGMSLCAEASITAEQLGDEALALGLALVEADTWAAAAPSGLARTNRTVVTWHTSGMSLCAEASITAEQLGDEALALGLALVEADTWAAGRRRA